MLKPKLKEIESTIAGMGPEAAQEYLNGLKQQFDIKLDKLFEKIEKRKAAIEKEHARLDAMTKYEIEGRIKGFKYIAGIDEAGRGPLAGPVVAAAVVLPEGLYIEGVNDSKKLSAKQRDTLFDIIKEKALAYGIGIVDEKKIDEINILNATKLAMEQALKELDPNADLLLLDAVKLENIDTEQVSLIKGDSLSVSIAAASILAKVTRDRIIDQMDEKYPQYGFAKHKGYGTGEHINAIKKFGICPIHRVSFTKNFV